MSGRSQLTTFPLLGGRLGRRFRTGGALGGRLIVVAAPLEVGVDRRIALAGRRHAPQNRSLGALRLRQLWLCHVMIRRLVVYVVVVGRGVVVDQIAEPEGDVWRVRVVVGAVGSVVQLVPVEEVASLGDALENRFDLRGRETKRRSVIARVKAGRSLDDNPKRSRKPPREKLIIVHSSRTACQHFRESVLRAAATVSCLISARTAAASPHVTFRTYFEVFTEHFLLVFMSIIDFRFVQFKYHISIGIG